MAIEFPCPHCSQLLRVGDETAGKTAKCPKCQGLAKIPGGNAGPSSGGAPFEPVKNRFADGGTANPSWQPSKPSFPEASVNPYASPAATSPLPIQDVPVVPQTVGIEPILNYAWEVWKENLGLLLGMTIVVSVIGAVLTNGSQFVQAILIQNNEQRLAWWFWVISSVVSNGVSIFLGIGQTKMLLKLARRQPVQFSELFSGAPLFLPILAVTLLYLLAVFLGLLAFIVPGIIVMLVWWPTFNLVVDGKAGIIESFSVSASITRNNWGTIVLMVLLSIGITALGFLACLIGLLFAAPLTSMLWAAAYLMMAGQIPAYGQGPLPPFTKSA